MQTKFMTCVASVYKKIRRNSAFFFLVVLVLGPALIPASPATAKERPLRFVVYGDSREGGGDALTHRRIMDRILEEDVALVLHTGDLVKSGDREDQWQSLLDLGRGFFDKVRFRPVMGNHDTSRDNRFARHFPLGRDGKNYYAFSADTAHFLALDSTVDFSPGSDQYAFAEKQLTDWNALKKPSPVFVILHHPPFSQSRHGDDKEVGRFLVPLFEAKGVDAVFAGHDHNYQRIGPRNGILYIVTGGGGAPLYGLRPGSPSSKAAHKKHHYVVVEVDGPTLRLEAKTPDGVSLDRWEMNLTGTASPKPADPTPEVEIRAPSSYGWRKFFLFPLELPAHAFRIATWPIAAGGRYVERNRVVQRTIDLLSNDDRTFFVYPLLEIGAGSGLGGGVGLYHKNLFDKGWAINLNYKTFVDLDHRASFSFGHPKILAIGDRPGGFKVFFKFKRESDEDFFGIGPLTTRAGYSNYGLDEYQGGTSFDLNPLVHFRVRPHAIFLSSKSRPSGGVNPPSADVLFPAADLVGLNRRLRHLDIGFALEHDTRDLPAAPQKGGTRTFSFRRMQGLGNGGFDFNQYSADFRQYFRLWKERRVLALRAYWTFQQETGTSRIPFQYLAALDLNAPLRGFDRGRFRDHSAVLFNAEYRYPVWDFIDGTIFVDTGRVFDDPRDFSFTHFKYSVGAGIRVVARDTLLLRLQAAYGGEGLNVVFAVNQGL